MRHIFQDNEIFISTGGRDFQQDGPVLLFIHGSGQSHLSFMQQGRYFANRGWRVINPDMPAHGLSSGKALDKIADMAHWYAGLLASLNISKAAIIGHSQGCLVALELGRLYPELVEKICFISGALAIPVNDALLSMAATKQSAAYQAMVNWAHGSDSHLYHHSWPGHTHIDLSVTIMAGNDEGALLADLSACNNYQDGKDAAHAISCPTIAILAEKDRMTPLKFGLKIGENITNCQIEILHDAGHFLPSERPFEVNKHLRAFLTK